MTQMHGERFQKHYTQKEVTQSAGSSVRMTNHHVPPRNPDSRPRLMRIDERHHRAYHLLFGSAGSLEDAIHMLARDWWTV